MGAASRVAVTDLIEIGDDLRGGAIHLMGQHDIAELSLGGEPEDMYRDRDDLACYCKEVYSMHQCVDNKHRKDNRKPSGPRYWHPEVHMKDGKLVSMCCKIDYTSWLVSWTAGWDYKQQDNMMRCIGETRPVPPTSCCRLKDQHGSFGIRIKSATSEGMYAPSRSYWSTFWKTPPQFSLEDITGGQDYTGKEIAVEEVREFVDMQITDGGRFHGKLQCGGLRGSFEELFDDTGTCQLRQGPSQQCCCHVASIVEATRCLPTGGAATEEEAEALVLDAKLETWKTHGRLEGRVVEPAGPAVDDGMQHSLKGVADPSMEDMPETQANESTMLWDWVKATQQWSKTCLQTVQVPYVKTRRTSRRVRNGQTCRMLGKFRSCSPRYKTVYTTHYDQKYKSGCVSWQWERKCAAGTGLYIKQINPGQCVREPEHARDSDLALTEIGPLLFMCPDDYSSGTGGAEKFHQKCECRSQCA
jgi:hypothetical protein